MGFFFFSRIFIYLKIVSFHLANLPSRNGLNNRTRFLFKPSHFSTLQSNVHRIRDCDPKLWKIFDSPPPPCFFCSCIERISRSTLSTSFLSVGMPLMSDIVRIRCTAVRFEYSNGYIDRQYELLENRFTTNFFPSLPYYTNHTRENFIYLCLSFHASPILHTMHTRVFPK